MIKIVNVDFSYNDRPFFKDLNLSFNKGETTLLIGPSGCGKSTILRLLCGLNRAVRGEIHIDGQLLTAQNLSVLRLRMGYVIQEGGLFPHLTARDNISLMARRLKWTANRIDKRVADLCELTRFPMELLPRKPGALSGGQRQRVSLMRALMLDPELLLLDEPLGALDPMIRAELQENLKEIFNRLAKTVIMVSHDLNEAAFLADRVILMNRAQIEQQGIIQELINRPASAFVTRFVESQSSHLPEKKNG